MNLRDCTILLTLGGSRAYGVHRPDSDHDVKGVAIPPAAYFHGAFSRFEQSEDMSAFADLVPEAEHVEGVVFDVRKFVALATECNPNILDVLFCREADVLLATPLGARLRESRDLFVSAQARFTFGAYAAAQLKRIKGHRKWLLDPPKGPPSRAAYGLPERTLIPRDQLAAAEAAVRARMATWDVDYAGLDPARVTAVQEAVARELAEIRAAVGADDPAWLAAARLVGLDDNLIHVTQKEREYESALRAWRQYEDWKRKRNPTRAALEARAGYDTKHAAHLVRLLRMGREILETGQVRVWRGDVDADELRGIRDGAWKYDRLLETAEREEAVLSRMYTEKRYAVPAAPDRDAIERLCVAVVEAAL